MRGNEEVFLPDCLAAAAGLNVRILATPVAGLTYRNMYRPRQPWANLFASSSAKRSQALPDRQIGATVSHMVGSKSADAGESGDRKGTVEWSSSSAGLAHDMHRRRLLLRICRWFRLTTDVTNLPTSSGSGIGLPLPWGSQRVLGACSRAAEATFGNINYNRPD